MFKPTLPITAKVQSVKQLILPGNLWISEKGHKMDSNTKNMIIPLFHVSVPNSTDCFPPACFFTRLLLRTS